MNPNIQKQLTVSRLEQKDIPVILEIQMECKLSAWNANEYLKEIERENSLMLVAQLGGTTIGYIAGRLTTANRVSNQPSNFIETELDVLNFGVFKKYQKQGIGDFLFKNLLAENFCRHLKSIWLEVRESNVNAIDFYKKRGFTRIQIRKKFYRQPLENAFVMKLDIKNQPQSFE